jgi:GGDEF domain-containing protein
MKLFEDINFLKADVPHLATKAKYIEDNREKIVDLWRENSIVSELFIKLDIDSDYFKTTFGLPVIEYFIGVLKREKELGNCPVMQKFISYLVEKNISSRDIFVLCMNLRKTIIKYLLVNKYIDKEIDIYLDEFSDVFDANLSGVLQIFSDLRDKREKEFQKKEFLLNQHIEIEKLVKKQKRQLQHILNFQKSPICVIKNSQIKIANIAFLNILGYKSIKELFDKKCSILDILENVEVDEHFFDSDNINRWVESVSMVDECKCSIKNILNNKESIFVLSCNRLPELEDEYIISFVDISEYENEVNSLKELTYKDSITKLNNSLVFEKDITDELIGLEESFMLLVLHIDSYKSLIDKYSINTINNIHKMVAKFLLGLDIEDKNIYRLNETSFAIVLQEVSTIDAKIFATNIHKSIKMVNFDTKVDFSIGVHTVSYGDTMLTINHRIDTIANEIHSIGGNSIRSDEELIKSLKELQIQKESIVENSKKVLTERVDVEGWFLYKECPLSIKAQAIKVSENEIIFKVLDDNIFKLTKVEIFLKNIFYDQFVKANVTSVNLAAQTFTIDNFCYSKTSVSQRKNIRVQPQLDFGIFLKYKKEMISGTIIDLSIKSIAIETKDIKDLSKGDSVEINSVLIKENNHIDFFGSATVFDIQKIDNKYKVILFTRYDKKNESILTEYISYRQITVIKEFKLLK